MAPNHDAHSQNTANGQGMKHQKTASHFILKNGQSFSETTVLIVGWVIYSILGRKIHRSPSPVERSVCKLTSGILAKHDVYNSLCVHLRFTPENLHVNFNAVADYIFEDGIIVWGRVIALLGFSVKVAEYFRIQGFGDHDQVIVGLTSRFIEEKIGPWIQNRGGWDDVITHFGNSGDDGAYSTQNMGWFKGILLTATATLGIGALLAVTKCK